MWRLDRDPARLDAGGSGGGKDGYPARSDGGGDCPRVRLFGSGEAVGPIQQSDDIALRGIGLRDRGRSPARRRPLRSQQYARQ